MASESKIRKKIALTEKEIASTDEDILQTRTRLDELNRSIATASEAELTNLKKALDQEKLRLQILQESLKASNELLEKQKKIADAASDSATKLENFVENSSISNILSGELAERYKGIGSKARELSDLAKDNAKQVKSVADFNQKVLAVESVREKMLTAIKEGDKEMVGIHAESLNSKTKELTAAVQTGSYTKEQLALMYKILQTQQDITKENLATIGLTKEEKEIYDKLIEDAETLKTKVKGIGSMISLFLKNPATLIGASIMAIGGVVSKIGEVNKKLGTSMLSMSGFSASAGVLSFIFDDAADTAKELAHHLGDSRKVTFGMQLDTNIIASNLNLTGAEAAELVSQFGELRGQTHDQAMNMIASAEATAKARGVVPADLVKDLAANTEAFSKFAKGGGENMLAAAAGARQLGLDLKTVTTMADTLLDFETSIEKELELSAMLGKDINLNKARELFYAGDLEGATKAVIQQLGTKAQFDKMDVYQKKAAADALGIQVTELEKMYKNQENIAGTSGVVAAEYSKISEISSYIANEWGGGIVKGIGSAVIVSGQLGMGLKSMGLDMGKMVTSSAQFVKNLVKAAATKIAGVFGGGSQFAGGSFSKGKELLAQKTTSQFAGGSFSKGKELLAQKTAAAGATPSTPTTPGATQTPAKAASAINPATLLSAAVAMVAFAAAIYILAQAFKVFSEVENPGKAIGLFMVAVTGMVIGLSILAPILTGLGPILLPAAGILLAFGASMLLIAGAFYVGAQAMKVLAEATNMFGPALTSLSQGITAFVASPFMQFSAGLLAMGAALVLFGGYSPFIALGTGALIGLSYAFNLLSPTLPIVIQNLSTLSQISFLPILGLAGALTALAIALNAVAIAGVLALPALAGIGMMAGAVGGLFGGGESGGDKELLDEIKGLRADLNNGKVAVYMDGTRVTAAVASSNASNPVTV